MSRVGDEGDGSRLGIRRGTEGAGEEQAVVLSLSGELDLHTLGRAQHELETIEADAPARLLVDLSALEFMDSSGVRLVLLAHHRAGAAGRHLAVRLGYGPARRVFGLLGLIGKLDVR